MDITPTLPDASCLSIERVALSPRQITLVLSATQITSCCPRCHHKSKRVHSRYTRQVADLPWTGIPVHVELHVRRFFCDNKRCQRVIFTERLPKVVASYARKTCRLDAALGLLALALGGEHGARVARELAMARSPDTLLRLIRRLPLPAAAEAEVVGVDDWALRKGARYGTILCDLERHRVLDLLPDHAAESLRAWLAGHPGIKFLARDRGGVVAQGATAGAPQARQVADRFHLLMNLREALIRVAERFPAQIRAAWQSTDEGPRDPAPEPASASAPPDCQAPAPPAAAAVRAVPLPSPMLGSPPNLNDPKRLRRLERYEQVHALHRRGLGYRTIADRLGIAKNTARRLLRARRFPERALPQRRHRVAPYTALLWQRWQAGLQNAMTLWKGLCQEGFVGSYHMVRRWVQAWRMLKSATPEPEREAAHTPGRKSVTPPPAPSLRPPSCRQTGWYLMQRPEKRRPRQQRFVEVLVQVCPVIADAVRLAQNFASMVREGKAGKLAGWIASAKSAGVPKELTRFAEGLLEDRAAVAAALRLPWSNGQVEGQINRVKLLKREMYGRANFDLLRRRVLLAS